MLRTLVLLPLAIGLVASASGALDVVASAPVLKPKSTKTTAQMRQANGTWKAVSLPTQVEMAENLTVTIDLSQIQSGFQGMVKGSGVLPNSSNSKTFGTSNFSLRPEGQNKTRAVGSFDIKCQKWAWGDLPFTKRIWKTHMGKATVRYSVFVSATPVKGDVIPKISFTKSHRVIRRDDIARVASFLGIVNIGRDVDRAGGSLRSSGVVRFQELEDEFFQNLVAEGKLNASSTKFVPNANGKLSMELTYTPKNETVKDLLKEFFTDE